MEVSFREGEDSSICCFPLLIIWTGSIGDGEVANVAYAGTRLSSSEDKEGGGGISEDEEEEGVRSSSVPPSRLLLRMLG